MWVIWNASHVHRPTITEKRHSSRQAQTQTQRACSARHSRPGPGQNLRGNSIYNNREKGRKRGTRCLRDFFVRILKTCC